MSDDLKPMERPEGGTDGRDKAGHAETPPVEAEASPAPEAIPASDSTGPETAAGPAGPAVPAGPAAPAGSPPAWRPPSLVPPPAWPQSARWPQPSSGWSQPSSGWPQQPPGWSQQPPNWQQQPPNWPQQPPNWPSLPPVAAPYQPPAPPYGPLPYPPQYPEFPSPPAGPGQTPRSLVWPDQPARRSGGVRTTALAVLATALIAFGGGLVVGRAALPSSSGSSLQGFDVYNEALSDIQQHYVNAKNVDDKTLVYGAIRGMVEALGDTGHSRFLTPEEYAQEQASLNNQTVGIGIVVSEVNGVPTIERVLSGTPAEGAGLKAGDQIVAIDGQSVTGGNLQDTISRVRGTAGTSVKLTVLHAGSTQPVEISVTRAILNIPLVEWAMIPGTTVADISLSGFDAGVNGQAGAADQVWSAIQSATRAGAKGMVFDLRGNPGGYVDQAVDVASEFIPTGTVFIQVSANGARKDVTVNPPSYHRTDLPVVVLVDNNSASAAEIVAGALQDAGRAKVVGVRTFGTGTVLNTYRLSDGSVLLLGTSKFLTRNGNEILNKGISPDKTVGLAVGVSPLEPADVSAMNAAQFQASQDAQLKAAVALVP